MKLKLLSAVAVGVAILLSGDALSAPARGGGALDPAVKPQAQPIQVDGEVVDAWCYASKAVGNGRGAEHAQCANACAHGGVTLGIVDEKGNLYIAAKYKAYQGCQHILEPFVAKRVHVNGWVARLGGCQLLKITDVHEINAQAKTTKLQPAKRPIK